MQSHSGEGVQSQDAPQQTKHVVRDMAKNAFIAFVRFYQKGISPLFPPTCRYMPTCSEYAIIAVQRYGFMKGFVLATKRILRCHPFHEGGYDPVP